MIIPYIMALICMVLFAIIVPFGFFCAVMNHRDINKLLHIILMGRTNNESK